MNKWFVVTTINPPGETIHALSALCLEQGWRCVVVGDRKTPPAWGAPLIDFLSVETQHSLYPRLAALMPYNHYCRKNLGYLYAANAGADIIYETDDDNIPLPAFGKNITFTVDGRLVGGVDWVNAYAYFTEALIWPRGNPLDSIHDAGKIIADSYSAQCPVQQFLADGDPDVDAIYRLLFKRELSFDKGEPLILAKGTLCSFNSQNTLFFKGYFPLMYLPCHVSFRMTDIWRSLVAQAVLWSTDRHLSFAGATVVHRRNEHNLMGDFSEELPGYLDNRNIGRILRKEFLKWPEDLPIKERVILAWAALQGSGFIREEEMELVKIWMDYLND